MPLTPGNPTDLPTAPTRVDRSALRRRSLANVLRAGHCAPTVMKTLLDATGAEASWLIRLATGLPGGIGNTGRECGAITSSLVVLGMRHARDRPEDGVPVVVSKGRALLRDFQAYHGSHACRDIMWHGVPIRCVGVVRRAPERCVEIDGRPCSELLSPAERRACARLHAHLVQRRFHCAHAVLREVRAGEAVDPALLDATSAFVGGTAYAGLTCSALTAGVMLLGLAHGQAVHSPRLVLRAMLWMASGGHAFAHHLDALNVAMNEGHELARWFRAEFGSTQCRALTGADFSTPCGADRYVETDGVGRCREIARAVAERTRVMIDRPQPHQPVAGLEPATQPRHGERDRPRSG